MNTFSQLMKNVNFPVLTQQLLEKIVNGLYELDTNDIVRNDIKGDLCEYMQGKLSTDVQSRQFCTHKQIREILRRINAPQPGKLLCNPAYSMKCFEKLNLLTRMVLRIIVKMEYSQNWITKNRAA